MSCKAEKIDLESILEKLEVNSDYSNDFKLQTIVSDLGVKWEKEGDGITFSNIENSLLNVVVNRIQDDQIVTLKASITYKGSTKSKLFTVKILKTNEDGFKPVFNDFKQTYYHKINTNFTYPILKAYDHLKEYEVTYSESNLDITKEGTYLVSYEVSNDFGVTKVTITVIVSSEDGEKLSYYEGIRADESDPESLISELRVLVGKVTAGNGSQNLSYNEIRDILLVSDIDIDNRDKLRGIYKEEYFNKKWDSAATWNREHVWPQSRLANKASGSARNQASDAHNLRVIGTKTNSDRGNDIFTNKTVKGSTYFPSNRDKGDVARIMLYMVVRYSDLSLNITGGNKVMGDIRVFNNWHNDDLPDNFEIQRNNVIEDWQGNRNPFIDNPEWFYPIWNYLMEESGIHALAAIKNALETYHKILIMYVKDENLIYI